MPFEVIHGNQRFPERQRQHFAISQADEQRAYEPRTLRDADGVDISERDARLQHCFAHHRHDLPKMLARRQLRHHAAVFAVNVHLRCDDARQDRRAIGNNSRGCLIARRFNSQNSRRHLTLPFRLIRSC